MKELVEELYQELDSIFKEHTTHNWKNGWEHEGDRESTELTIQKNIECNNLFLLRSGHRFGGSFKLDGPQAFMVSASLSDGQNNSVRFDIESEMFGLDIYYYISEDKWNSNKAFIINLCNVIYESSCKQREALQEIPTDIYGEFDPVISLKFYREEQLKEILKS